MLERVIRLTAVILCASPPALGEGVQSFRLTFAAPAGCSSAAEMTDRIVQISARAHAAGPAEPAFEIGAEVVAEQAGFTGRLRVRTPEATETTRVVPAATCAEVVDAMALIAAMVIDPGSVVAAGDAEPAATSVAPSLPAPASGPPPVTPQASRPASALPTPGEIGPEDGGKRAPRYWLSAVAEVGLVGALAPELSPDLALGLGFVDTRRSIRITS